MQQLDHPDGQEKHPNGPAFGRTNIRMVSECVWTLSKVREISKFLFRHENS